MASIEEQIEDIAKKQLDKIKVKYFTELPAPDCTYKD